MSVAFLLAFLHHSTMCPRREAYQMERVRAATFEAAWRGLSESEVRDLGRSGFVPDDNERKVVCVYCMIKVDLADPAYAGQDPMVTHAINNVRCPAVIAELTRGRSVRLRGNEEGTEDTEERRELRKQLQEWAMESGLIHTHLEGGRLECG